MINRIEITTQILDARAATRKKILESYGFKNKIKAISLIDVFTISKDFSREQLRKIASLLINPVTQSFTVNSTNLPKGYDWVIEIGFLPGVTDNISTTAKETVEDSLKVKFKGDENIYTSQITLIKGRISKDEVEKIASTLFNPLIQRATVNDIAVLKKQGVRKNIPQVKLDQKQTVSQIDLNIGDEELKELGKKGIKNPDGTARGPLALSLAYLKTIQSYFKKKGRKPTDIELESIAQTWSEHCKHTIFADPIDEVKDGLFKTYIKGATEKIRKNKSRDFCYSVFTDNSGAIELDAHNLITAKVETHNSPSALDPFGGAVTGIVGVNRDTIGFGLGAKPIINQYGFCFADPKDDSPLYKGADFSQPMLSPRRIMDGVISGVNAGGNCSGIPTPQGFVYFDEKYKGKPLVFVGTLGLIPKQVKGKKMYLKKARPGDYIVMVGGRVGLDGIHGATFSSEAMDSGSPSTAVQIGDPITQKKLSDALVKEARDLNLYNSITDNGAGGLSCSVAEMAKESGGFAVNLDLVPMKYPGLDPWQIWISESQERMTLAIPKNKWLSFNSLMKKRGVEATRIGEFNKSGRCVVKFRKKIILDLELEFLHNGLPSIPMRTSNKQNADNLLPKKVLAQPKNLTNELFKLLQSRNIAGFDFISAQYDHEVQGTSVLKPLQGKGRVNSDTSVTRPLRDSKKGVLLSQALYPSYSDLDPYLMAASSIDTAIRNIVAAGADPDRIALLDNFCWCSSNDPYRLGQLKKAALACYDLSISYGAPFISGKDSMFNDFKGYDQKGGPVIISIPPTLLISSLGVIDNVEKTVSLDFKFTGDLVYLLGDTADELGGSEYCKINSLTAGKVPKVDAAKNKKIYKNFFNCVQNDLIASAISVQRGGLAAALAKSAIAGMVGVEISLKKVSGNFSRDDFALFSESQGRILLSINPENRVKFEKLMAKDSYCQIGKVRPDSSFIIKGKKGNPIIKTTVNRLLSSYRSTFKNY